MSDTPAPSGPRTSMIEQHQYQRKHTESGTAKQPSLLATHKRRKTSTSPKDSPEKTKPIAPRRRLYSTKPTPSNTSRSAPRSSTSPNAMSLQSPNVNLTKTGRISKAKKGLKVHNCDCGRSYTRAEHLRRHQMNHRKDEAFVCDYPSCGKSFARPDLFERHRDRHNETTKDSRQQSVFSTEHTPESSPMSVPATLPAAALVTPPATSHYVQPMVSPVSMPNTLPRYTQDLFRTPQLPHTPRVQRTRQGFSSGSASFTRPVASSTSSPNQTKQRDPYGSRHSMSGPVPVEATTPGMLWDNSFGQSPCYSSSSGYASPNHVPEHVPEYANMFPFAPHGPGYNRTRTSSNVSFIEPWQYSSGSPASSVSYAWMPAEKGCVTSDFPYMTTSYPVPSMQALAGADAMAGYEPFSAKTMQQRDEEEGIVLFPEQQYGMGHLAHYPLEQYLDSYWRHFHPTFPVVHRFTFEGMSRSPMLYAAMLAVGGQYSSDDSVQTMSRELHQRCVKLLERRDQVIMAEPERLCDYQAIFLVEIFSQYRARRCSRTLSSRFEMMYSKLSEDFRLVVSQLTELVFHLSQPENITLDRWAAWIRLSTQQRLFLSCYILESQQATLLAQEPKLSLSREFGEELPFPGHASAWEATSLFTWATATQQHSSLPRYVYEVSYDSSTVGHCDYFQSAVLIAAHYNHFGGVAHGLAPPAVDLDHLHSGCPTTRYRLLTAKLLQLVPLRALLAVSGETWILSEKVATQSTFSALRTTLQAWLNQLWLSPMESSTAPIAEALKLSAAILRLAATDGAAMLEPGMGSGMGSGMGIYFASLVLWASTAAASTRMSPSPLASQASQHSDTTSLAPHPLSTDTPLFPVPRVSHTHTQITTSFLAYLDTALPALFSSAAGITPDAYATAHAQSGALNMLLWVKMRLRGGYAGAHDGEQGDLASGVVSALERLVRRGWSGWGI